ncbi:hypothetical protein BDV26DRAFT_293047 [Aspergillus bertholletiae]|uniref:Uncharacterized protein n=1 Tax=Aspergillus bertholletiae TaxID=1226010 RepID=A0A5N7B632_9EURO|nr:hypothetical protein BDV26DRAFT_293047 [Aspergillus bertholletiae]
MHWFRRVEKEITPECTEISGDDIAGEAAEIDLSKALPSIDDLRSSLLMPKMASHFQLLGDNGKHPFSVAPQNEPRIGIHNGVANSAPIGQPRKVSSTRVPSIRMPFFPATPEKDTEPRHRTTVTSDNSTGNLHRVHTAPESIRYGTPSGGGQKGPSYMSVKNKTTAIQPFYTDEPDSHGTSEGPVAHLPFKSPELDSQRKIGIDLKRRHVAYVPANNGNLPDRRQDILCIPEESHTRPHSGLAFRTCQDIQPPRLKPKSKSVRSLPSLARHNTCHARHVSQRTIIGHIDDPPNNDQEDTIIGAGSLSSHNESSNLDVVCASLHDPDAEFAALILRDVADFEDICYPTGQREVPRQSSDPGLTSNNLAWRQPTSTADTDQHCLCMYSHDIYLKGPDSPTLGLRDGEFKQFPENGAG